MNNCATQITPSSVLRTLEPYIKQEFKVAIEQENDLGSSTTISMKIDEKDANRIVISSTLKDDLQCVIPVFFSPFVAKNKNAQAPTEISKGVFRYSDDSIDYPAYISIGSKTHLKLADKPHINEAVNRYTIHFENGHLVSKIQGDILKWDGIARVIVIKLINDLKAAIDADNKSKARPNHGQSPLPR